MRLSTSLVLSFFVVAIVIGSPAAAQQTTTVPPPPPPPQLPQPPPVPLPAPEARQEPNAVSGFGVRFVGGVVTGPDHVVVTPGTGLAPAIATSPFSEAAAYLAGEAQPVLASADNADLPEAGINPFVNVRLTTIAVTALNSTGTTGGFFLQNHRAVQYEFGGAFLAVFHGSAENFAGAVGPVGRYMLQTVTDPEPALRIWDLTDDTLNAWTIGARASVLKKTKDHSHWEHAAYVDFSWGKFENYETATGNTIAAQRCLSNPTSCITRPEPVTAYTLVSNWRTYIQARVVLGFLYAGFDFNLGQGLDDTKFMIGGTIALSQFGK